MARKKKSTDPADALRRIRDATDDLQSAAPHLVVTVSTVEHHEHVKESLKKKAESLVGSDKARRHGHDTQRDKRARGDARLLAAVRAYRAEYPKHGRAKIAKALLEKHGWRLDYDPEKRENVSRFNERGFDDQEKAIAALAKKIERLEKSQDS